MVRPRHRRENVESLGPPRRSPRAILVLMIEQVANPAVDRLVDLRAVARRRPVRLSGLAWPAPAERKFGPMLVRSRRSKKMLARSASEGPCSHSGLVGRSLSHDIAASLELLTVSIGRSRPRLYRRDRKGKPRSSHLAGRSRASSIALATACELSRAGKIPSVRASVLKAASASSSRQDVYRTRPVSFQ